jgi:hypothetical protein
VACLSYLLLVLREELVDRFEAGLNHWAVSNAGLFDELVLYIQFLHRVNPAMTVCDGNDLIDIAVHDHHGNVRILHRSHSPIFFVTGDKSDIAHQNGMDDFKRITKVPAIHTYKDGVSHGGTYSQPNGGDFARVAVAMLQWQLKGDKNSSKMFLGENCGPCQYPQWHVSTKG